MTNNFRDAPESPCLIDPPTPRLEANCELYCRTLDRRLGFGKDGSVWLATNANAVKLYEQYEAFERERNVYRRLAAHGITDILGSAVPQVVEVEPTLGVIEMSFVRPPFVLDFATAELDHRTEFPE